MHVSLAAFGLYFWLLLWTPAPVISADNQVPVSGQESAQPPHKYVTARSLQAAGLNRTVETVGIQTRLSKIITQVLIAILGNPLANA
jgi:hypothetical protein